MATVDAAPTDVDLGDVMAFVRSLPDSLAVDVLVSARSFLRAVRAMDDDEFSLVCTAIESAATRPSVY